MLQFPGQFLLALNFHWSSPQCSDRCWTASCHWSPPLRWLAWQRGPQGRRCLSSAGLTESSSRTHWLGPAHEDINLVSWKLYSLLMWSILDNIELHPKGQPQMVKNTYNCILKQRHSSVIISLLSLFLWKRGESKWMKNNVKLLKPWKTKNISNISWFP